MMTFFRKRFTHREDESGVALVLAIVLTVVALIVAGALSTMVITSSRGTAIGRAVETARAAAEAGINTTAFKLEAGTNPATGPVSMETYLAANLGGAAQGAARPGSKTFTGTVGSGSYTVTLTDPNAGDSMLLLTAVGKDTASKRTMTMEAVVRADPPAALNYAMFGNTIEFHNHNKVPYGVTLNTTMFSNGYILIDQGVSILGQAQGVNYIKPTTGKSGIPDTILSPAGQQGDPRPITTVPGAQVVQVVPPPPIQPFPTFDFLGASQIAAAAGRSMTPAQLSQLLTNAQACANKVPSDATGRSPGYAGAPGECSVANVYLNTGVTAANVPLTVLHYKTETGASGTNCPLICPNPRPVTVPNGPNPNAAIPLGSPDGVAVPANHTNLYEIRLNAVNAPAADTLLYVTGSLTLTAASTTLVQIQGSLIVNGSVSVAAPTEILAWHNRVGAKFVPLGQTLYDTLAGTSAQAAYGQPFDVVYSNWPAIAANGAVKLSSTSFGTGGPVHIEGVVYSVAESHIHKSEAFESSYAVGSEIADKIHNCQWFSFAYDPQAKKTLGFFVKASGRAKLQVIRLTTK